MTCKKKKLIKSFTSWNQTVCFTKTPCKHLAACVYRCECIFWFSSFLLSTKTSVLSVLVYSGAIAVNKQWAFLQWTSLQSKVAKLYVWNHEETEIDWNIHHKDLACAMIHLRVLKNYNHSTKINKTNIMNVHLDNKNSWHLHQISRFLHCRLFRYKNENISDAFHVSFLLYFDYCCPQYTCTEKYRNAILKMHPGSPSSPIRFIVADRVARQQHEHELHLRFLQGAFVI